MLKTTETDVQAVFDRLEKELTESAGPGVFDVLRVYGDCEAAMQQADSYLAALTPATPRFSTTANTFSK